MATRVPYYPAVCLGGITVGLVISFSLSPGQPLAPHRASGAPPALTTPALTTTAASVQPVFDSAPTHIAEMVRGGRLMEAQDAYLEILVVTPGDEGAMRGLVAIRRRLALNDPALLRRQAEAYGQAASNGVEISGEHYTRAAMAVLAEASLRAAQDVENSQGQKLTETSPP